MIQDFEPDPEKTRQIPYPGHGNRTAP